ncbi:MAG: M48 family metallopeptidase [Gammaproteobacteria bacterium]|nr:M48 family metallopeptidase [Gammaproteobacteria bacterium]
MQIYRDIEYELKKSVRKTTSIYIERDGTITVLAPQPYDMSVIESILESKRSWIYRNLAEWEDLNRTRIEREFVNGEGFPYLGSTYKLQIVNDANQELILKNGAFILKRTALSNARDAFVRFYKTKARVRLPKLVDKYAKQMGLEPSGIKVQELKNRWASCTPEGMLNFHWRCMMAPLSALEYIVVHELAHLKHSNHTTEFWYEIEKVLPDYPIAKGWLRLHGAALEL